MKNISKETKISIICHSIAIFIAVGLMMIASFYDLKLSQAIGDQSNFFGQLFAIIGEYPSYLMIPVCGTIFFYNSDLATKRSNQILIKLAGSIIIFTGLLVFGLSGTKIIELPHNTLWSIFNAFFYGAIYLFIGYLIPKDTMHKLLKFATFALTFILVALLVMRVMKLFWCRMRYRDMLKEGNFDGFSDWWIPMFGREKLSPDYHYTSFPSGHSSSLVHLFLICVLCDILPSWKKRTWLKPMLYAICTIIVAIGAFSRIINCAHFLSDIVMGSFITYGIFYLIKWLFFRNGEYEFKLKNKKDIQPEKVVQSEE